MLRKAHNVGFTMVELAMVLGVISAVSAAIWVAYSNVKLNNQVRLAQQELTTISNNVRSIYNERGTIQGYEDTLTLAMDNLQVFPPDMKSNITGRLFNPWSAQTTVPYAGAGTIGTVSVNAGSYTASCSSTANTFLPPNPGSSGTSTIPTTCFVVTYYNVPAAACTQLLVQTSQPQFSANLLGIRTSLSTPSGAAYFYTTAPSAAAACNPTPTWIAWFFALK